MPSFRLRVRTTEIDLPLGELVIGRGTDCFLRIDDEMVSRRHARLMVSARNVLFEDLGSRNGSRVNGEPITGSLELKLGDTFEIGSQLFQLIRGSDSRRATATMLANRVCERCRAAMDVGAITCSQCGAVQSDSGIRYEEPEEVEEETGIGKENRPFESSFQLLSGLGDKLLALGRVEEAERMIGPRLRGLLVHAENGDPLSDDVVEDAIRRGLRLASATGRVEWFGWIFDFARLTGRRIDDGTLDELHAHMLVHKPSVAGAVRGYAAHWAGDDPDRALHRRRLDALLRFCRE